MKMKMKISPQLNRILTWSAKGQNHPLKASQLILTTLFKSNKKLVSRANNHFLTLHQKRIYCQQWVACMWGTCDNDRQPHHSRNKHLANDLSHGSEAQNGKTRRGVQVLTLHWKHHLWSLPSRFPIQFPLTPSACHIGYTIGCRVKVSWLMAYQKWTLHQISISMGLRQGPPLQGCKGLMICFFHTLGLVGTRLQP
jgi:hypothetical protein